MHLITEEKPGETEEPNFVYELHGNVTLDNEPIQASISLESIYKELGVNSDTGETYLRSKETNIETDVNGEYSISIEVSEEIDLHHLKASLDNIYPVESYTGGNITIIESDSGRYWKHDQSDIETGAAGIDDQDHEVVNNELDIKLVSFDKSWYYSAKSSTSFSISSNQFIQT